MTTLLSLKPNPWSNSLSISTCDDKQISIRKQTFKRIDDSVHAFLKDSGDDN